MLLGELLPGDRQKIMTVCTIDVHARDVVSKLIAQKVGGIYCPEGEQLLHPYSPEQHIQVLYLYVMIPGATKENISI